MSLDFELAAKKLRCDVAAIKAVAKVEAAGEGFVLDRDTGKTHCVRLLERHKFHKFTGGRFDNSHPHLSDNAAGGVLKRRRRRGAPEEGAGQVLGGIQAG